MAKHIRKSELEGAKPVSPADVKFEEQVAASPSEAVAKAVDVVEAKKPGRKAKLKARTAIVRADVAPDYEALGASPEAATALEKLRLAFGELGQRSTEHVFECGAVMDAVHELVPDQATFAVWAKKVFGMSRTGAENIARVHRNLRTHRAPLVQLGLATSSLYVLATAEGDKIEEVVALAESGKKLSVAEVKAMAGIEGKATASPDDGGPEGLRAAIAVKTGFAMSGFSETLFVMLQEVHIALEPHHEGRDVNKSRLAGAIMHDARLAGGLLKSLVYAAQVARAPYPAGVVHQMPVADSGWVKVNSILYDLGSDGAWPKAGKLGVWLVETVVPRFEWALGPVLAGKARAVLEERAAAAEAAR